MVYTDVVLRPEETQSVNGKIIDLTGQYFIPVFALGKKFKIEWREKSQGSFTMMAMRDIYSRLKRSNGKGFDILYDDYHPTTGIPYFATYNSKRNEMTCYYFRDDDYNKIVTFRTFNGDYVVIDFSPLHHDHDEEGRIKISVKDTLDTRYMIARAISLCQKKVINVSYER